MSVSEPAAAAAAATSKHGPAAATAATLPGTGLRPRRLWSSKMQQEQEGACASDCACADLKSAAAPGVVVVAVEAAAVASDVMAGSSGDIILGLSKSQSSSSKLRVLRCLNIAAGIAATAPGRGLADCLIGVMLFPGAIRLADDEEKEAAATTPPTCLFRVLWLLVLLCLLKLALLPATLSSLLSVESSLNLKPSQVLPLALLSLRGVQQFSQSISESPYGLLRCLRL
mmetsp:Transcript_50759/g.107701  ORF Transcript_50759/g.107701 Transcript_50759/m.107701 type:complete len:228 (+) Transcript_50759:449-1132(+)